VAVIGGVIGAVAATQSGPAITTAMAMAITAAAITAAVMPDTVIEATAIPGTAIPPSVTRFRLTLSAADLRLLCAALWLRLLRRHPAYRGYAFRMAIAHTGGPIIAATERRGRQ
jgi:hypothetical protein